MNYSTSVFLINQKVRAVSVNYEPDEKKQTIYKTLDETIAAGDYVVVPTHTRHKFTVARVVEVDVDVDFDSPELMTWIVARIDRSAYDLTLKQEDAAIAVVGEYLLLHPPAVEDRVAGEGFKDKQVAGHDDHGKIPGEEENPGPKAGVECLNGGFTCPPRRV